LSRSDNSRTLSLMRRSGKAPPRDIDVVFKELITELERDLQSLKAWRDLLGYFNTTKPPPALPESLIGSVEFTADSELCLTKGQILVRCGKIGEANQWFRAAPSLATTRLQAFEITCRASHLDQDFRRFIAAGDKFRDEAQWNSAEYQYWKALALYPQHAGYLIQYAHCLKEQGKFADAEIFYRSALAYAVHLETARFGLSVRDILQHLNYVAGELGYRGGQEERQVAPSDGYSRPFLTERPTKADVLLVAELLLGHPVDDQYVLRALRTYKTVEEVFLAIIKEPEFARANRDLLTVYRSQLRQT